MINLPLDNGITCSAFPPRLRGVISHVDNDFVIEEGLTYPHNWPWLLTCLAPLVEDRIHEDRLAADLRIANHFLGLIDGPSLTPGELDRITFSLGLLGPARLTVVQIRRLESFIADKTCTTETPHEASRLLEILCRVRSWIP